MTPTMPRLDQQVTFLYAQDAPACWAFYENMLGLPLVQDQERVRIYAVAGGRAFLGLCMAGAARASANPRVEGGVCFTFVTQDVDGWYAYLQARGAAINGASITFSCTIRPEIYLNSSALNGRTGRPPKAARLNAPAATPAGRSPA